MTTRRLVHEETFPAVPPARLFAILHTPSAICDWWGAARAVIIPGPFGLWAAAWGASEDDPDYVTAAEIRVFEPPRRMVLDAFRYHAKDGPLPFEASFVNEFLVEPAGAGSRLKVTQDGFPAGAEADAFFDACAQGWQDTFSGIRRYLDASPEG